MQPVNIAFCIPGREFSARFLQSWTSLIKNLPQHYRWALFNGYTPNIFYIRQSLVDRAKMIRPTHYMWIDDDQVFDYRDFEKLFKHDLPIISGIYRRATGHGKVEQLSDKFACSLLGGKTLRDADVKDKITPMEVHANGFGFMLVKAEVFNRVITPFQPTNDTEWEDFAFAERARKLGYKSYIDPSIIIGHEKKLIL